MKSRSESLPNFFLSDLVRTYFRSGAVRAVWHGPVLVTWGGGAEKARYLRVHCDMALSALQVRHKCMIEHFAFPQRPFLQKAK